MGSDTTSDTEECGDHENQAWEEEQTQKAPEQAVCGAGGGAGGDGGSARAVAESEPARVFPRKRSVDDVSKSDGDHMHYAELASKQFTAARKINRLAGEVSELEGAEQAQSRQLQDTTEKLAAMRDELAEAHRLLASLEGELARALENA